MISNELINPRSIVIVGGSNDLSKPGGTILKNIIDGGFNGAINVLNLKEQSIKGAASFHDAESLPDTECAIFAVPPALTVKTAELLADRKKTKAFIVLSAGFSETGAEGVAMEKRLIDIVNGVNGTLIGPNCTGVLFPGFMGAFAGPMPRLVPHGIDFVAASGAVVVFTMERALPMGIQFSSVIAVGNSAQCGVEDIVRHWDETFDASGSTVKLLYIEQIKKPEILIKHCRSLVNKGARIAAIKAGTTEAGSRAAYSHTGALAGSDIAIDALFRKCGITRCYGREELIYTAGVLMQSELRGGNIAVVTHAGGPGVMAADELCMNGLSVPPLKGPAADKLHSQLYHGSSVSNPIDFIGTGTAEQLEMILDFVDSECPEIDGSVVIFGSPGLFDVKPAYEILDKKMNNSTKPIYPVLPSTMIAPEAINYFISRGRVFFPDEVLLSRALAAVYNTTKPFNETITKINDRDKIRSVIENSVEGYLHPEEIKSIISAAKIPAAREIPVTTEDQAESASRAIGFPLVMKVIGPVHKSDAGGVKLNISTEREVNTAFAELMNINGASGVLMQEPVKGVELYIGGKHEPGFGHIILCGIGGIFVEILKDISAGIVPVGMNEAHDMIRRLRGYNLIKGTRGREGVDEESFAKIITNVSSLLSTAPEIKEIDINPLIGHGDKILSVDCRIFIDKNI